MIRLNRIQLNGFKSIRKMDLELRPLNVLIGANGAGKSNFVSFFKMLNFTTSNSLQLYIGQSGGANSILHYGSKETPLLTSTLYFNTDAGNNVYHMRLVSSAGDTLLFADEQISFTKKGTIEAPLLSIGSGHKETMMLNPSEIENKNDARTAKVIRNIMNRWRFYQFHDTSDEANIKKYSYIEDNRYLRHDAGNLAAYLYYLKRQHNHHYQRIVATIRQVAPFFEDFILVPSRLNKDKIILEWKEIDSEMIFNANQLSDGTIRFISLATLLLQPELPSLISIDEPELGLHPYAIRVLATLLKGASKKSQIIVSTQSVSLINELEVEDLIVVDRVNNQTKFNRLNEADLSDWLEEYTLSELWDKNVLGGRPTR